MKFLLSLATATATSLAASAVIGIAAAYEVPSDALIAGTADEYDAVSAVFIKTDASEDADADLLYGEDEMGLEFFDVDAAAADHGTFVDQRSSLRGGTDAYPHEFEDKEAEQGTLVIAEGRQPMNSYSDLVKVANDEELEGSEDIFLSNHQCDCYWKTEQVWINNCKSPTECVEKRGGELTNYMCKQIPYWDQKSRYCCLNDEDCVNPATPNNNKALRFIGTSRPTCIMGGLPSPGVCYDCPATPKDDCSHPNLGVCFQFADLCKECGYDDCPNKIDKQYCSSRTLGVGGKCEFLKDFKDSCSNNYECKTGCCRYRGRRRKHGRRCMRNSCN